MGKKDTVTKKYMKNPAVFADAFNKFLYHGRQVIKPETLTELDTTEIALPFGKDGATVPSQKYRDVLKLAMTDGSAAYCLLGIENQSSLHFAMPVKNMVYDAMQFARQISETAISHRQKKEKNGGGYQPSAEEYLGGFYKTDRLLPVITLTIFWGAEKWDAPLSLKELYATTDETILTYAPDYQVNLIAPAQMSEEEIDEFQTSLREIMLYIKYSKDKTKLWEVTQANPNFRTLSRTAAEVINVTTNSKLRYPEGKEAVDVCAAIQELMADSEAKGEARGEARGEVKGEARGKIQGAVGAYKEVGLSLEEVISRIARKFDFSLHESEEVVKKYW